MRRVWKLWGAATRVGLKIIFRRRRRQSRDDRRAIVFEFPNIFENQIVKLFENRNL
jgi:hypothetical protein